MKKQVAERIRLMRLSRNLSQENMADELGLSVGAYSNIERGVTDISITRLEEIAGIFEVAIIELIDPETASLAMRQTSEPEHYYGYASKEEVAELRKSLNALKNEVKKIKQELNQRRK